jgi:flavodoxin
MKKALVVVYSYHHMNTEKIARVMAEKLKANLNHPGNIDIEEIKDYNLVGFGAGIDSGKHYEPVLKLAADLPMVKNKMAFIFSTSAIFGEKKMISDHAALRDILISKGYDIVGEFSCPGFNTNSFIKYFGGMNRGRPNAEDLAKAEDFAAGLKKYI